MLDPWYKSLQIIQDYVGLEVAMQIVTKYDHEILMPLFILYLLKPLWVLNLDVGWFKLGIFGYVASIEKTTMGILKVELSLYRWVACQKKISISWLGKLWVKYWIFCATNVGLWVCRLKLKEFF
jgi:hypothetical protein